MKCTSATLQFITLDNAHNEPFWKKMYPSFFVCPVSDVRTPDRTYKLVRCKPKFVVILCRFKRSPLYSLHNRLFFCYVWSVGGNRIKLSISLPNRTIYFSHTDHNRLRTTSDAEWKSELKPSSAAIMDLSKTEDKDKLDLCRKYFYGSLIFCTIIFDFSVFHYEENDPNVPVPTSV